MAKNLKPGERVIILDMRDLEEMKIAAIVVNTTRAPIIQLQTVARSTTYFAHECQLRRLVKKKAPEFWICKYALDGHDGYEIFAKTPDGYDQKNFVKVRLVKVKGEK